jgi:hypothetical protein
VFVALALIGLGHAAATTALNLPQPSAAAVISAVRYTDGRGRAAILNAICRQALRDLLRLHLPDVCPAIAEWFGCGRDSLKDLGAQYCLRFGRNAIIKELAGYVSLFGAPVVGLTGTPAQIAQVKKQFGISPKRCPRSAAATPLTTATVLSTAKENSSRRSLRTRATCGLDKLKRITG